LWRRLPPERVTVLTTPYTGDREFDADQPYRTERVPDPVLLPIPTVIRRIRTLSAEVGARLVVLDPALPLGLVGPRLGQPYVVVVHGAELAVPGRLPVSRSVLAKVLRGAQLVVAAGEFVRDEARSAAGGELSTVTIPPGVDVDRFRPLSPDERRAARAAYGILDDRPVVVAVTRLVPRKGIDVLIAASSLLKSRHPDLQVVVAGGGRDRTRLEGLVNATGAPVRFVGRLSDAELPRVMALGDAFAMPCRARWGGLEQEGFGIVLLEAAACGVPQVTGDTGGAAEAVAHGETGFVVRRPADPWPVADALDALLSDESLRARMGAAGRRRAEGQFSYDRLAVRLDGALTALE
jgi:phosphatidylinositol alpha-1,6-mannosyltransferase